MKVRYQLIVNHQTTGVDAEKKGIAGILKTVMRGVDWLDQDNPHNLDRVFPGVEVKRSWMEWDDGFPQKKGRRRCRCLSGLQKEG